MIRAKLFILRQEFDLLWTDMNYVRETNAVGKPTTGVSGGMIRMAIESSEDSDILAHWITKDSGDDAIQDIDLMEEGEIHFYDEKNYDVPIRSYKFSDTMPVSLHEVFSSTNEEQMIMILTISPAIQEYASTLIKEWNVSYVPPTDPGTNDEEEVPDEDPQFLSYHFEDEEGEKITQDKIKIDDTIYLVIETVNADGEKMTLNLDDDNLDYEYNGKVLENDTLKGISITGDLTKVKLKAVSQESLQES